MKALETIYKGYRFRSRLEARTAVFMDQLGIQWLYEPEGYDLDGLWYLPDFYLPELRTWVEIKPEKPTGEEEQKAARLAYHTAKRVVLFYDPDFTKQLDPYTWCDDNAHAYWGEAGDYHYLWCICPWCGAAGIEFDGRGARVCRRGNGENWHPSCRPEVNLYEDKAYSADHDRIIGAIHASRAARFT